VRVPNRNVELREVAAEEGQQFGLGAEQVVESSQEIGLAGEGIDLEEAIHDAGGIAFDGEYHQQGQFVLPRLGIGLLGRLSDEFDHVLHQLLRIGDVLEQARLVGFEQFYEIWEF
jgi:hypothetical protein